MVFVHHLGGVITLKVDLREEDGQDRQHSGMLETAAGRMVAEEFGAQYFECSAKTGLMVEEAFVATATKVHSILGILLATS